MRCLHPRWLEHLAWRRGRARGRGLPTWADLVWLEEARLARERASGGDGDKLDALMLAFARIPLLKLGR